eukprot:7928852-Pyramimonas_sp.AAC.1
MPISSAHARYSSRASAARDLLGVAKPLGINQCAFDSSPPLRPLLHPQLSPAFLAGSRSLVALIPVQAFPHSYTVL